MSPTAYSLRQPVTARKPSRWDIYARYAMRLPDETLDLPAGTWLLALPEAEDGRTHSPHYQLADGRIVCLDAPLTAVQADPLTDSFIAAGLRANRNVRVRSMKNGRLSFPTAPYLRPQNSQHQP